MFEPIDQRPARLERLPTVHSRHRHHDRSVTDGQLPDPVKGSDGHHRHARRHLVCDLAQLLQSRRVGGVRQLHDAAAAVVVTHRSEEQAHAAGARIGDEPQALVGGQRLVTNVEQEADATAISHSGTVCQAAVGGTTGCAEGVAPAGGPWRGSAAGSVTAPRTTVAGMSGQFPFGFGPGSGGSGGSGGISVRARPSSASWRSCCPGRAAPSTGSSPVRWPCRAPPAKAGLLSKTQQAAVREAGRLANHWLDDVTTLPGLAGAAEELASWSRTEWVERTLPVWQTICDPVASKVVDAMGSGVTGGLASLGNLA